MACKPAIDICQNSSGERRTCDGKEAVKAKASRERKKAAEAHWAAGFGTHICAVEVEAQGAGAIRAT